MTTKEVERGKVWITETLDFKFLLFLNLNLKQICGIRKVRKVLLSQWYQYFSHKHISWCLHHVPMKICAACRVGHSVPCPSLLRFILFIHHRKIEILIYRLLECF